MASTVDWLESTWGLLESNWVKLVSNVWRHLVYVVVSWENRTGLLGCTLG